MNDENLLVPNLQNNEEENSEYSLRPKSLNEYIGQTKVKENMKIYIEAAKKRGEPLDHVLLYGPPGLGKTTLANIIATEMNSNIKITSGPAIEKPGDLAALLTNLSPNDVLFIDEIHRLNRRNFVSSTRRLQFGYYYRKRTKCKVNKIRLAKIYFGWSNY